MKKFIHNLDTASLVTLTVTFVLFVTALFFAKLAHDMLLEAGVFLVSVKLILMSYHLNVRVSGVQQTLAEMKETLRRIETRD